MLTLRALFRLVCFSQFLNPNLALDPTLERRLNDPTCAEYQHAKVDASYKNYHAASDRLERCRVTIAKLNERITNSDKNAGRKAIEHCPDPRVLHSHRDVISIYQSIYQLLAWPYIGQLDGRLVHHYLAELHRRYE